LAAERRGSRLETWNKENGSDCAQESRKQRIKFCLFGCLVTRDRASGRSKYADWREERGSKKANKKQKSEGERSSNCRKDSWNSGLKKKIGSRINKVGGRASRSG